MTDHLLSTIADGILTITLNRPDKRNALTSEMIGGIATELARAELEPEVRVVEIRGAGQDFCAGADLAELLASVDRSVDENERDALRLGEVLIAMRQLPKPVVAVVHGRALAGGAGIASGCDILLAGESARFGYPEIERGFVPAMVMTALRRSVGEKRAFDLVATGRIIAAAEALSIGLVSRVFADDKLDIEAAALLKGLASRSTTALALTKQLFTDLDQRNFDQGIMLGARVNALSRTTADFKSGVSGFFST